MTKTKITKKEMEDFLRKGRTTITFKDNYGRIKIFQYDTKNQKVLLTGDRRQIKSSFMEFKRYLDIAFINKYHFTKLSTREIVFYAI